MPCDRLKSCCLTETPPRAGFSGAGRSRRFDRPVLLRPAGRDSPVLYWRGLSGSKLVEDMLTGYDTLQTLVSDISLVVPGHDPLVTELFPAYGNSGFVWRLDKGPTAQLPDWSAA